MIRSALRAFVLLAGLALAGCAGSPVLPLNGVAPSVPGDTTVVHWWSARPMTPTTMHAYVYMLMEECMGTVGDFWRIRWYSADFLLRSDYQRVAGLWIADPPRIILDWRVANDPVTTSHEILHDLPGATVDHDAPRFDQCEIKRLVPVGPE